METNNRREFFRKTLGFVGVTAATAALSKLIFIKAEALEIGDTSKATQNPMDVSGQCGMGMGCSGGGGQCGIGMGCSGGGGQCGIGMGCSGS